jgi:hypothetical protein
MTFRCSLLDSVDRRENNIRAELLCFESNAVREIHGLLVDLQILELERQQRLAEQKMTRRTVEQETAVEQLDLERRSCLLFYFSTALFLLRKNRGDRI